MQIKKLANNALNFGINRFIEILVISIFVIGVLLLIFVFSGKIKFGSSGEKLNKEISNKKLIIMVPKPTISIILLILKFSAVLANFLIFIN